MLTVGELLADRYRVEDRVAAGGMGDVWRATDTVLGRRVAVKMLHSRQAGDTGFQTRFRHEARTMAALHHPGIADVYDYGESEGDAYLVMAYVDGEPLDELIAASGRLGVDETMSIVAQAAHALQAAHLAGIVHRDVKPGNLIVRPDGTVVLVDFGVARSANSMELTGVNEVIGTALYIAPEQVSKQATGPATDVYALGAVAYHCLAGRPPFLGDNPVTVAIHHLSDDPPPLPADVPPNVRDFVATAMAKDPADRFPSATAMADAATVLAGGSAASGATTALTAPVRRRLADTGVLPVVGDPGAPEPYSARPYAAEPVNRRRHRAALAWAAVLLGLTILGLVLAFGAPGGLLPGQPTRPSAPAVVPPGSGAPAGGGGAPQSGGPGRTAGTAPATGNPATQPGGGVPAPGTTAPGNTPPPPTQQGGGGNPEPTPTAGEQTPEPTAAATG